MFANIFVETFRMTLPPSRTNNEICIPILFVTLRNAIVKKLKIVRRIGRVESNHDFLSSILKRNNWSRRTKEPQQFNYCFKRSLISYYYQKLVCCDPRLRSTLIELQLRSSYWNEICTNSNWTNCRRNADNEFAAIRKLLSRKSIVKLMRRRIFKVTQFKRRT